MINKMSEMNDDLTKPGTMFLNEHMTVLILGKTKGHIEFYHKHIDFKYIINHIPIKEFDYWVRNHGTKSYTVYRV